MTTENIKLNEVPAIRRYRERNSIRNQVLEFLESDEEVLVFRCESHQERISVYNNLYAFSKRRHDLKIKRFVRGNDVYVTKAEVNYE